MSSDPGLTASSSPEKAAVVPDQQQDDKSLGPYTPSTATTEQTDIDLPNGNVKEPNGTVVTFPDGGLRAWLVVAGSAHILFCTFGFVVSVEQWRAHERRNAGVCVHEGVGAAWLQALCSGQSASHVTCSHSDPQAALTVECVGCLPGLLPARAVPGTQLIRHVSRAACGREIMADDSGWIGSLQYMLIYLPALPMGRLVDTSKFQYPFWIAGVLYPVASILTAQVSCSHGNSDSRCRSTGMLSWRTVCCLACQQAFCSALPSLSLPTGVSLAYVSSDNSLPPSRTGSGRRSLLIVTRRHALPYHRDQLPSQSRLRMDHADMWLPVSLLHDLCISDAPNTSAPQTRPRWDSQSQGIQATSFLLLRTSSLSHHGRVVHASVVHRCHGVTHGSRRLQYIPHCHRQRLQHDRTYWSIPICRQNRCTQLPHPRSARLCSDDLCMAFRHHQRRTNSCRGDKWYLPRKLCRSSGSS